LKRVRKVSGGFTSEPFSRAMSVASCACRWAMAVFGVAVGLDAVGSVEFLDDDGEGIALDEAGGLL
jgi:hypothetical protein